MNTFLITFSLITLASCSSITLNDSRAPSSVIPTSTCHELLSPFLLDKFDSSIDLKSLLEKGLIKENDLKILEGKLIRDSLALNPKDSNEMQVSYLLIKKRYPHFGEEQILGHYELLTQFCGL